MTYSHQWALVPSTWQGMTFLLTAQLLSLCFGHLGPVITLAVIRGLLTSATCYRLTTSLLTFLYHYLLTLLTKQPIQQALTLKIFLWGKHLGRISGHLPELSTRLARLALWRTMITL